MMMPQAMETPMTAATVLDQQRFTALWRATTERHDHGHCDAVFAELAHLYTGPDRHYHSDEHINLCLTRLDEARESTGYAATVELAVWFHDAIFEPGDPENERKSAAWFRDCADGAFSVDTMAKVESLIVVTTHRESPQSWQEKLMVDVDLSSFGLPWKEFIRDSRNIRREFKTLTDAEFIQRQGNFIRQLDAHSEIYYTDFFKQRYEPVARENIRRLLDVYESGVAP